MSLDVYLEVVRPTVVYQANITHNLGRMAMLAGLYEVLWRPEELSLTRASHLIPLLEQGLALLEDNPTKYEKLNPENGWGTYEGLVEFVRGYLAACREHPDATISVNR